MTTTQQADSGANERLVNVKDVDDRQDLQEELARLQNGQQRVLLCCGDRRLRSVKRLVHHLSISNIQNWRDDRRARTLRRRAHTLRGRDGGRGRRGRRLATSSDCLEENTQLGLQGRDRGLRVRREHQPNIGNCFVNDLQEPGVLEQRYMSPARGRPTSPDSRVLRVHQRDEDIDDVDVDVRHRREHLHDPYHGIDVMLRFSRTRLAHVLEQMEQRSGVVLIVNVMVEKLTKPDHWFGCHAQHTVRSVLFLLLDELGMGLVVTPHATTNNHNTLHGVEERVEVLSAMRYQNLHPLLVLNAAHANHLLNRNGLGVEARVIPAST